MTEPPSEMGGRRVDGLPGRGNEKTEWSVNGEPALSQTRKGLILGFSASRIVAVRFALTGEQWEFLLWLSSLKGGWIA
jgi:hypothetical protein